MVKNKKILIAKAKAKKTKRDRIGKYYNSLRCGEKVWLTAEHHNKKEGVHTILAKYELNDKYYVILQSKQTKVYLARIFYMPIICIKKVSKKSKEYQDSKKIFNKWIRETKKYRDSINRKLFDTYETLYKPVVVRNDLYFDEGVNICEYVSKYGYKHNYYFVVKTEDKKYAVVKIAWFGFAKVVNLSENERITNEKVFETWIKEARKITRRKK